MDIPEPKEFAPWIADALRATLSEAEHQYSFELRQTTPIITVTLDKNRLAEAILELRSFAVSDETTIHTARTFEVLLKDESQLPRFRLRLREGSFSVSDQENALTYKIASPSDAYLLFILMRVAANGKVNRIFGTVGLYRLRERSEAGETTDALDALRQLFSRFLTLQISSEQDQPVLQQQGFATSFLFHLSYNLDAALVPQRQFDELTRSGRISNVRKSSFGTLDPPRRRYISDLVNYYQLGVAGDNAFSVYLSYYHVAEHFFEEVFNDDLVERIKQRLTRPEFSYKRKSDINSLIKEISRRIQIRSESISFNEGEALRLTLNRYLDIHALRDNLIAYDSSLLTFYETEKVAFAKADEVDLTEADRNTMIKQLANRIYKVRNAIVHSKESEKARYVPFRDDRTLLREIPLLRFVAEQIIIGSSDVA
jgi:hypothetical protein